jgi:hypothetical protein
MDSYYFLSSITYFMKYFFLTFFIFVITYGYSQKKYYKLSLPLTISPSTESWMRPYGNPPEATNFIMFQPDNGRTIPEKKKQS